MRVIDASGRLFGKINLIDFCCLALVAGVGALVVAGRMHLKIAAPRDVVYFQMERPLTIEQWHQYKAGFVPLVLDVEVICPGMSAEEVAVLKPGERQVDEHGRVLLEVLSVEPPTVHTRPVDLEGGLVLQVPVQGQWRVKALLRLHGGLEDRRFYFQFVPVQKNLSIPIEIRGRRFFGNVQQAAFPPGGPTPVPALPSS
ncbi:MAG: hypothetical protein HY597_01085 [Candidatus Omnitrophica bacterium]|nr:hypothetical protein [Candidatus Omnitrophota bacterium]